MKSYIRTMIVVFSLIMVIICAGVILMISGIISTDAIGMIIGEISSNEIIRNITYGIAGILMVLAIISILGSDSLSSNSKGGIILPDEIGEVQIANQTFENIITNITKKYAGIKTGKVDVKVSEEGLNVDIFAYVLQDTVISDLTSKLKEDIKDTILKQTTVEVKNVNVKIKGTYTLAESKE